ncbi:MAG: hypothetical protein O2832_02095 [Proteobacteria bacterium]|nr:hypothetical protein [Pseudomonadota bacterium]
MSFIDDMQERDLTLLQTLDGRAITYTPNGGIARTISGMLQEFTQLVDGGSVEVVATHPVLSVRSVDIPEIATDDAITVAGVNYKVVNIRPDNEGIIELILEKL